MTELEQLTVTNLEQLKAAISDVAACAAADAAMSGDANYAVAAADYATANKKYIKALEAEIIKLKEKADD